MPSKNLKSDPKHDVWQKSTPGHVMSNLPPDVLQRVVQSVKARRMNTEYWLWELDDAENEEARNELSNIDQLMAGFVEKYQKLPWPYYEEEQS